MGNFKEDIAKIKALVFDVDGVFTDGGITVTPDNEFVRTYNAKDGFAIKFMVSKPKYKVAIITGGKGNSLLERFKALGIKDIYYDCFEKYDALKDFIAKHNLSLDEILYMGDDIPDIEPMQHVAMPVCPADAASEVISVSRYVSGYAGGDGCVRDIVEQVMRSQNDWFDITADYKTNITSA